jgi:hypothetical protein
MRYDSKYFYNFERDKERDHEYRVDTDCKKMASDLSQRTALKTLCEGRHKKSTNPTQSLRTRSIPVIDTRAGLGAGQ